MTKDLRPLCEILDPKAWSEPSSCLYCDEIVEPSERCTGRVPHIEADGKATLRAWHRECLFRSMMGGVLHIEKRCSCYVQGGPDDTDDPALSRRDAARAAVAAWCRINGN